MDSIFFKQVCIPEIIDFLSCFKSSDELLAERVQVLDFLLEMNAITPTERMQEVEDIISLIVIDSGTSEINGPKIFVDSAAIKRKVIEEIRGLTSVYTSSNISKDSNKITIFDEPLELDHEGERHAYAYASGGKNALLLKIWRIVLDAFLFDEKNGLDKNLSAEIRHGFFSNLMRARLEERYLITELDESGKYKPNEYWKNQTIFLVDEVWQKIEQALSQFSGEINNLITEAEGWMRIKGIRIESINGIDINLAIENLLLLGAFVEKSKSAESIIDYIIGMLWEIVDTEISKVRDRLNVDFKRGLEAAFYNLESRINDAKKEAPLVEMMATIRKVRSDIQEDVTTASQWFYRTNNTDIKPKPIDYAIKIAVNAFERVTSLISPVDLYIDQNIREKTLQPNAVKPFINAIINLLDNSFRHSGLGRNTTIQLHSFISNNLVNLTIRNNLSLLRSSTLTEEDINAMNAKIASTESISLLRVEGGSGIVKAYMNIIESSPRSQLIFKIKDSFFYAEVYYSV